MSYTKPAVQKVMTTYFSMFILSFLIVYLLTPALRRLALSIGAVDLPGERKIHRSPVPRMGGVVIFIAFYIPVLLTFVYPTLPVLPLLEQKYAYGGLFIASLLVFLSGVADDVRRISPWVKLLTQVGAALILYYAGFRIELVTNPFGESIALGWLAFPATILWVVLLTNAFNLIDGLDGLAAGVGFIISAALLVLCLQQLQPIVPLFTLTLMGGLLAFLLYNFNPASIFMGDSGSLFLGFVLAALSIASSQKGSTAFALLAVIIVMGLPILDTGLSVLRRLIEGRSFFLGDAMHIHHKLLERGFSHRKAVLLLYGICLFLGIVAATMAFLRDETTRIVLALTFVAMLCFVKFLHYHELENVSGRVRLTLELIRLRQRRGKDLINLLEGLPRIDHIDSLWNACKKAFAAMGIQQARLQLRWIGPGAPCEMIFEWRWPDGEWREEDIQNGLLGHILPMEQPGRFSSKLWIFHEIGDNGGNEVGMNSFIYIIRALLPIALTRIHKTFEDNSNTSGCVNPFHIKP
ncbi:MAG: undecaprenyl/decaprenyl-phosphate alpha-N-acetylglucosaminyl 1-phosphate transferase [Deltaproteobacteria bacterium]|nr:undecaprenyl/decaprenyl-phosphate alpha-N-acetylglucosaminyl 1-phosphate transferase [Deltaproteobacteria bacterium]MBW2307526.1 undecaprenyl/decaprenyl-phosphate alpha-N-acetylglucosaminyl 1-phosphate transferase [Deltaproteobacteria bacterium]